MKTLKIIVKGYVQRVGYREEIEHIARELGIIGYAKNLEDKELSVEIVAQHKDDNTLKQFTDRIKIKHYPIEVREIKSEFVDTKEDYAIFTVIHGSIDKEFGERMVEARRSLDRIENKLDDGFSRVEKKLDSGFDGVRTDLKEFNNSTQQRFDHLDVKYGKVSDKLGSIDNHLKELVEILRTFKPK